MTGYYSGVIIQESLADLKVLKNVKIISTKIVPVTERHKTPWVKQWTMQVVEISEDKMEKVAQEISAALENKHPWYADFKSGVWHYIIFRGKIFKVDRTSKEQYLEAKKYGLIIGIPEYQVDFHPEIDKNL